MVASWAALAAITAAAVIVPKIAPSTFAVPRASHRAGLSSRIRRRMCGRYPPSPDLGLRRAVLTVKFEGSLSCKACLTAGPLASYSRSVKQACHPERWSADAEPSPNDLCHGARGLGVRCWRVHRCSRTRAELGAAGERGLAARRPRRRLLPKGRDEVLPPPVLATVSP